MATGPTRVERYIASEVVWPAKAEREPWVCQPAHRAPRGGSARRMSLRGPGCKLGVATRRWPKIKIRAGLARALYSA